MFSMLFYNFFDRIINITKISKKMVYLWNT